MGGRILSPTTPRAASGEEGEAFRCAMRRIAEILIGMHPGKVPNTCCEYCCGNRAVTQHRSCLVDSGPPNSRQVWTSIGPSRPILVVCWPTFKAWVVQNFLKLGPDQVSTSRQWSRLGRVANNCSATSGSTQVLCHTPPLRAPPGITSDGDDCGRCGRCWWSWRSRRAWDMSGSAVNTAP